MRIKFNKLTVASGKIGVSLNNGQSFEKYDINDQLIESGIELSPEQQFDQVILRGDATTLKNLEVINYFDVTNKVYLAASIENYLSPNTVFKDVTATIIDRGSSYNIAQYEGIIVNKFWLKDKFELDNFDQKQNLIISDNTGYHLLTPIGYSVSSNNDSVYDLFFIPRDSYIICGNKYFHVLNESNPNSFPGEDDIIVKDLPSASIFLKGESVYSKAGLFIDIKSELEEIIDQYPSDFAHYDYTLTSQVNGGTATTIGTINNKTVALNNGVSNIYTSGVSIQITLVGEHEYNYIAHNVDDNTPYNITFTEQNKPELPPEPTRELGHFEGWFMDEECTQSLNWGDIDEDSHIYAKWTYDDATRKLYLEENSNIFVAITQPYNSTISLAEVQAKFTEKYGDKVTINAIPEVVFNTKDDVKLTDFTLANVKLDFTIDGERVLGDDALDVPFGSSINTEDLLDHGRSEAYLAIYNKHPIYAHQYFYASTSSLTVMDDINTIPLSIGTGGYYLYGADELSQKFLNDFNIGYYFSNVDEIPSPINLGNSPFVFTFKIGDTDYIPENGYFDFKKLPSPNHSVYLTVTATVPNNTLQVSKGTTAQTSVTIDNIFATTSRETLASLISNEDLANVNLCMIKANLYGKEVTVGSEGLPPVSLAATGTEYSLSYIYLPYNYNTSANIVYIDEEDKNCTLPITITNTETPGEYTLAFGAPEDPNNAFPDEAPDEWELTVNDAWNITVTPSEDPRTSIEFQLDKSTTEQAQFTLTVSYPQEENISRDNIYIVDDDFEAPNGDYVEPTE